jgi:hypothetical protein
VRGLLARYTNGLAHLSVDRSLRRTTVVCHTLLLSVLVHLSALTFVVGLTLGFLFLLLCLPFFANFLKLWPKVSIVVIRRCWWMTRLEGKGQL